MIRRRFSLAFALTLAPLTAWATPSTNIWAPSLATCQPYLVPHLDYDTYMSRTAASPIDTGIVMGIINSQVIQSEIGYDLLLPSQSPVLLNAKLCLTENRAFTDAPAFSIGMYGIGFSKNVNDYDILYAMAQKSLPFGGFVAIGVYHSLSSFLTTGSNGQSTQTGLLASINSPDIPIGLTGLKKIVMTADLQTGYSVLGAATVGPAIYFSDWAVIETGPVFYLDPAIQPGGSSVVWAFELDLDIPLSKAP